MIHILSRILINLANLITHEINRSFDKAVFIDNFIFRFFLNCWLLIFLILHLIKFIINLSLRQKLQSPGKLLSWWVTVRFKLWYNILFWKGQDCHYFSCCHFWHSCKRPSNNRLRAQVSHTLKIKSNWCRSRGSGEYEVKFLLLICVIKLK